MPIYDPRVHRVDREKLTERRQAQLIEKANIPVRFDYAVDLIKNSVDGRPGGEGRGAAEGGGGAAEEGQEPDQLMGPVVEAPDAEASPVGAGRGGAVAKREGMAQRYKTRVTKFMHDMTAGPIAVEDALDGRSKRLGLTPMQ